jgi:hypothetical protein
MSRNKQSQITEAERESTRRLMHRINNESKPAPAQPEAQPQPEQIKTKPQTTK